MTSLLTIPQEMFFVVLTMVFIAAIIGDFSKARFFRSYKNTPSPWKDLSKDMKLFFLLMAAFMTWAQSKDSMQSGNGDWLSGEALEAIESEYYYSLPEEESGITWALLTGNPPFTSNAVLTASQFQAGFACVSVTDIQPSALAAPANAVTFTNWPYAVARQAVLLPPGCLPQGFTFGGRTVTNLYMAASGMLSFDGPKSSPVPATNGIPDGTALNYISVLQTPSDIVPTNGLFWYVTGTNSSVFTWKDVYLGQDTNCIATVQAELYANGDFTCRYSFPSPTYSYSSIPDGLLIGAQNNLGGETVLHTNNLLAVHSAFMSAFELRWKSLAGVNPAIADQDDDSLSTADELFIHRTDPRRKDSDGDGLTDPAEITAMTDPRNPDTNNDGIPDGIDFTGYSLSDTNLVFKLINNIAPSVDPILDTDNDGWADWLELRFGTDTNYFFSTPDGLDNLFSVTVTLAVPPPETGVLAVGTNLVMVTGPGSWTFWRTPGEAHPVSFTSPHGVPPSFQITLNRPSAARYDIPQPAGKDGSFGKVALPLITFDPEIGRCCHEARTGAACQIYTAVVSPQMPGAYVWDVDGTWFTNAPTEVIAGHDVNWVGLRFTASGASSYREAWAWINYHCAMAGVDTNNPDRVAVNNNDDDADGTLDDTDTEITVGDPDLQPLWPLGRFDGTCCPCSVHQPFASAATLAASSQKLALYTDSHKTNAFGGTIHAGEAVYVEGLVPSTEPYAEKIVWQWTEDNETKSLTNALTVLSVRIFPDLDTDDDVDASDIAGLSSLSSEHGWLMPVSTNILRKLRLRTDVGLSGGAYTLSLSGEAGTFKIWADNSGTNAEPLLVCGQTITNGIGGVTFLVGEDSDLYVEAASNGTATLTYAYTGEGGASNIACFAGQVLTAMGVSICSAMLDEGGRLILGTNGQAVPAAELGWEEVDASTYNPLSERGLLRMDNVSALLGGIQEWVTFIETQTGAELTITKSDVAGYMTWDLEYAGMTNGMPYYTWSDGSNSYVRVAVTNSATTVNTTNGVMGLRDLHVTLKDESFNYSTNEWNGTLVVYRDVENASDYFSNYTMSDPREDVGLPPFSDRNALVVRFDPMGMTGDFVCTATDEDDNETEIPLTQQSDGTYVSALIVPISELDGEADLGLLSNVGAVRLKLADKNTVVGWQHVNIEIKALHEPARKILKGKIRVKDAMLLSGLVTDEGKANYQNDAVVEAGGVAVKQLHYGVTPIFSPEISTVNSNLLKHSVWLHTGHGHWKTGILLVQKINSQYRKREMMAADITRSDLKYDLVFMNTCYSTDTYYSAIRVFENPVGWDTNKFTLATTAVMDIGTKLNAKNYIGWDCEAHRTVASDCLVWLMQYLDTDADGATRSVEDAVTATKEEMRKKRGIHELYKDRLRLVTRDDSVILDLNKKRN